MPHDFFYMELIIIKRVSLLYSSYIYSPDLAVITQLLDKATTMRLLVSHHSVPSASTWAGSYYHYSLLRGSFLWLVSNLAGPQSQTVQASNGVYGKIHVWYYDFQMALKDLPRPQHLPNTLTNNCSLRYTVSYHTDPLMADDGSRKHSAIVERRPSGKNEVS